MAWLDNSRVIAILAVVFLHTASGVVSQSDLGSSNWWVGNFYDSFVRWCVPVFVMISGALLLDPNKHEEITTFYKKRAAKLLVPTLFWTVFFSLWGDGFWLFKVDSISLVDLAKRLVSGKTHYHLWFLYMIIMLYLFTPFFRKIVINSTRKEIVALVFFSFALAVLNAISDKLYPNSYSLFIYGFLSYIPYFFLGYLIRTDERKYSRVILWSIFFLSTISTFIGCYTLASIKGLNIGLYFYGYLSITVIPMSVSIMYLLKYWIRPIGSKGISQKLALSTLGVYLIHPIVLETLQYFALGPLNFHPLVSIPVITVIAFCFSFITTQLIFKISYLNRII